MFYLLIFLIHADGNLDVEIKRAAKIYNLKENDLKAISIVESQKGTNTNVNYNKNGTKDVGPFQINSIHFNTTCKQYNILTLQGNTLCAAKIVAQGLKYKHKDAQWLARYHSKTPSLKAIYQNKLNNAKVLIENADKYIIGSN